jgi:DNA-binding NarL/FixJ family response regulator
MNRPRIVLADDHALVLEGLHKILEDEYDIVGMAEDGRTLLKVALQHNPDVVVLDISMPQLNGLDAARQLHKLLPTCKIIFLTMHADPTYAKESCQSGATALLRKRAAAAEFVLGNKAVV